VAIITTDGPIQAIITSIISLRFFSRPSPPHSGTIHGHRQDTSTYVYMVSGIDYQGKVVTKKGAFTLVR
jgi:hypothetical protein